MPEDVQTSCTKQLFASLISIHDLANLPDRSNYLIERAKISGQNAVEEKAYNNKIVIIEPDEAMNILLKTILELQGYEVLTASVFEEVSEQPAVIILDAGSADSLKGLDLCKTLRQNSEFSGTKLIVTSILHDKELILNCGADLYLPKPYELSNLIKWVKFFVDEVNFR